ncbi:MAG: YbhB/YbcL family Raf kinase inhibitor-like protein [Candidatus Cybelea sp.]|jgi:Raf kinase inhibitor-like YbhB/YbcL family protein
MTIRSSDVPSGGVFPLPLMATDCGGQNRSPALAWSANPTGTKSFALVMHDPDAPMPGGFYHWVVYNIPAGAHALAADAKLSPAQLGSTSAGKPGYYGPCPPPGPAHHYTITLFALDLAHIATNAPLDARALEGRAHGHVLARAVLTATASHH